VATTSKKFFAESHTFLQSKKQYWLESDQQNYLSKKALLCCSLPISVEYEPLLKMSINNFTQQVCREVSMKKIKIFIPYLALLMMIGSIGACASHKDEKSEVIKKTTTTTERPAVEETKTTTTIERQ
jgi:hypothetical protein